MPAISWNKSFDDAQILLTKKKIRIINDKDNKLETKE